MTMPDLQCDVCGATRCECTDKQAAEMWKRRCLHAMDELTATREENKELKRKITGYAQTLDTLKTRLGFAQDAFKFAPGK